MSCQCQLPVKLRAVSRTGNGSAYACVVAESEGVLYQTTVDTHTHANGSWTVTTSITGGPINDDESSCGDVEVVSTYDSGFDYGAEISVTTSYSGAVSLASIVASAMAALAYGSTTTGGWLNLERADWFSNAIGLPGPSASSTAGETSTVDSTEVQFELSGYAHLDVTLSIHYIKGSDSSPGATATVVLTAAAPNSGWISAPTPPLNDSWDTAWIAVRIGPYNTTNVPLP